MERDQIGKYHVQYDPDHHEQVLEHLETLRREKPHEFEELMTTGGDVKVGGTTFTLADHNGGMRIQKKFNSFF
ncbi:MAG: hypothetical protein HYZ08_01780 [Candidatus Kerfeldbacteria bacterium]|nr:hypothetical protein [Candidatus Kerfeldbacteria bacterium]